VGAKRFVKASKVTCKPLKPKLNICLFTILYIGAICISKVLKACSLQVLSLSYNNIGDDGITAIVGALNASQINELDVSGCGITLAGAKSLAVGLKLNNSVKKLVLAFNDIGDDGIIAITGALNSSQINEFDVSGCGITLVGARSLSTTLLWNNSIKKLSVEDNPISVEGACLMLQSAVENSVCHDVGINSKYYDNIEVNKMMIILNQRKKQKVGGYTV